MTRPMSNTHKMFNSLVANAVEFMERAAQELEGQPKYSVIDFFAGLELFLKARLLKDHWSLVIARPEKANLAKFLGGDFVSVGFEDAVYRLRHIADEPVSQEEFSSFNALREHRNKLVHFFHEKYADPPDTATIAEVVSEQCKAWFYLHRLITARWSEEFTEHRNEIERLNANFRDNRRYLDAKWTVLKPEVEAQTKGGTPHLDCNFCGYPAVAIKSVHHGLHETACRVCDAANAQLLVKCPECSALIEADDVGGGACTECGFELDWDSIAAGVTGGEVDSPIAFCTCGYGINKTVVPVDDAYLCLSCLETGESLSDCEWCSEPHLGDLEDSYVMGCTQCDGRWRDDD